MIVGIPNVGKSTFINSFAGKACAKTGNKPGVTKGKQWIRLNKSVELLDTPGILWPKFEDQQVGLNLAFIGSIKDELYNVYELSLLLLDYLIKNYPGMVAEFYGIEDSESNNELLERIAVKRGCLKAELSMILIKQQDVLLMILEMDVLVRLVLKFLSRI